MNRNVILLTQFSQVYLLTESYIVQLEIYVVPIGHGFSFFWSWKSQGKSILKKRGTLCVCVALSHVHSVELHCFLPLLSLSSFCRCPRPCSLTLLVERKEGHSAGRQSPKIILQRTRPNEKRSLE